MSPLLLQSFTFVIDALAFPHIFFSFFIAHLIHGVYIFIAHLFFCFVYCPPHICLGVPRKLPKFPVTIQQGRWVLLPPLPPSNAPSSSACPHFTSFSGHCRNSKFCTQNIGVILQWKRKTKSINVNSFDISARYCAN